MLFRTLRFLLDSILLDRLLFSFSGIAQVGVIALYLNAING
jgi:hypothetical protein